MENYREKLKIDNFIIAAVIIALLICSCLAILSEAGVLSILLPAAGDSHWASKWRGFLTGASTGILVMLTIRLVQNLRALRDEKKLKKLYIRDHDERTIQVWTYARAASMQTNLLLGIAGVVISGYFSSTVSLTILVCVFCASLITIGYKVYYSKKF